MAQQQKDHRGRFTVGNQMGAGNFEPAWLKTQRRVLQKQLADAGPRAVEVLEGLLESEDEKVKLATAMYVVNKVDGKPTQHKTVDHGGVWSPTRPKRASAPANSWTRSPRRRKPI